MNTWILLTPSVGYSRYAESTGSKRRDSLLTIRRQVCPLNMSASKYPRPGFRIAPLSLLEILDVPYLRHSLRKLCGKDVVVSELDESSWRRFSEGAGCEMGK